MTSPPGSSDRETLLGMRGQRQATVQVQIEHSSMRRLIIKLLERDCGCRVIAPGPGQPGVLDEIDLDEVANLDIVIVDEALFRAADGSQAGCGGPRVIVIAPEPDVAYQTAAVEAGAESWIPRERVGDELPAEVRRILTGSAGSDGTAKTL